MFCIFIIIIQISAISSTKQLLKIDGDLNVALVFKKCNSTPFLTETFINSAIWTVKRLNFIEFDDTIHLGLRAFEVCDEKDLYNLFFNLFQSNESNFLLGVVTNELGIRIKNFCSVLDLRTRDIIKNLRVVLSATISAIKVLNLNNVTIWTPSEYIVEDFFDFTSPHSICVVKYSVYNKANLPKNVDDLDPIVIFGEYADINFILSSVKFSENGKLFIAPLDGTLITEVPHNSYILQTSQYPKIEENQTILTPLFFEVANPIINLAQTALNTLRIVCNETLFKVECLRNNVQDKREFYTNLEILNYLKIEELKDNFVYNILQMENNTFKKIFSYNIFDEGIIFHEEVVNSSQPLPLTEKCKNYKKLEKSVKRESCEPLKLRKESWVFAFLSISLLGVLFCVAIFLFLTVRILKKDILEGNPFLTHLLLLVVMLMFCAVIPFCIELENKEYLCVIQSLSVSLAFSAAFSIILSRSILLASSSRDIEIMSHIPGSVQFFLSLFIFAVQAALDLQITKKCLESSFANKFVTLLSYNIILIVLLLCFSPLIVKCKRNYMEGKYFAIGTYLTALIWSIWVPLYVWMDDYWMEPLICFGLVSTAAVFVGSIFIPRTYLMILATARDKTISTMPSLVTATSFMDIYRANSQAQPVYDCINVAVVNSNNSTNIEENPTAPPYNLYSRPNMPEDNTNSHQWEPTTDNFKITRF